jgi:hypothetical protein
MFKTVLLFIREKMLVIMSLASLVVVLLLPFANPYFYTPNRDNGFHLYAGRFILNGGVLYKALWEERPPAMFYLDALGLWIGRDSRWGVWLVEVLFLSVAAWVGYQLLKRLWQPGAAVFGSLMWLLGLSHIMVTGNLVEEYPILFGFLALLFFVLSVENPDRHLYDVLVGVAAAFSFLFRANTVGVEISIGLTWLAWGILSRHYTDAFKRLALMAFGAAGPLLLVGLYFWYQGTLYDAVVASVLYSLFYTGEHGSLVNGILSGFAYVGFPAWTTLAGFATAVLFAVKGLISKKIEPILLLLVILWPLEAVLSGLSGREYEHYFVSWGPAVAISSGFVFYQIGRIKSVNKIFQVITHQAEWILVGLTIVILIINRATVLEYRRPLLNLLARDTGSYEKTDRVTQYIDTFTDPGDKVLAWGGQSAINYMAHRDTSTAFSWYPTYADSPFTSRLNDGFLTDLENQKPEIIVDAYMDAPLEVPSINNDVRSRQSAAGILLLSLNAQTPNLPQVLDFIKANYDFETTIDQHDIYRFKGSKWKTLVPPPYSW